MPPLRPREISPFPRLQVTQVEPTDANPDDLHDGQANLGARFADLLLAAFAHDHARPGALAEDECKAYVGWGRAVTILQHNAPPPGRKLLFVRAACD